MRHCVDQSRETRELGLSHPDYIVSFADPP